MAHQTIVARKNKIWRNARLCARRLSPTTCAIGGAKSCAVARLCAHRVIGTINQYRAGARRIKHRGRLSTNSNVSITVSISGAWI